MARLPTNLEHRYDGIVYGHVDLLCRTGSFVAQEIAFGTPDQMQQPRASGHTTMLLVLSFVLVALRPSFRHQNGF